MSVHRRFLPCLIGCALLVASATADVSQAAAATSPKTTRKATTPKGLYPPTGRAPRAEVPFLAESPIDPVEKERVAPANRLFTMLVIGSDARPKENVLRTRADSLHLFVWNPATNQGALLGFPRDSYVDVPGRGKRKINDSLGLGGPALVMATVNGVTKQPALKVERYVVTGFAGFEKLINEIGGVNVLVDPLMNDSASGAKFAKGWHAMNGPAALAFARDRKDVAGGDLGRSLNQGRLLLYTLAKLREEVSDVAGLTRWVQTVQRNTASNLPLGDFLVLSQIARSIDPVNIQNRVLTGKQKTVSGASVIALDNTPLTKLMADLATDGLQNGR